MHLIPLHIENLQAQAVFTFMGAMEEIHAKSYSTIFTTLATDESINPIVENGLRTETKNHDFFSVKGNGYVKATNVEKLQDDDFIFE
jgi:ribonucleotide reductase beta subunit family protein with ferritin-like domain